VDAYDEIMDRMEALFERTQQRRVPSVLSPDELNDLRQLAVYLDSARSPFVGVVQKLLLSYGVSP
jgi:hypothetical protein